MSGIFGGGGGGNDNLFWEQKAQIDNERNKVDALTRAEAEKNRKLAADAEAQRLQRFTQGGLASLASNGYAGFSEKTLGGETQPLGA